MNNHQDVMKLALEALESCQDGDYTTGDVLRQSFDEQAVNAAIVALWAALSQEQAEPVQSHRWEGDHNIESPNNACMHKSYCISLKAKPVQEPVAWIQPKTVDSYLRPDLGYETCSKTDYGAFPVYTAPPKAEPAQEPVKFWPLAPLTGYYDVGGKRVWLEKDEPFPEQPRASSEHTESWRKNEQFRTG